MYCARCESHHSVEFGEQFHDQILEPKMSFPIELIGELLAVRIDSANTVIERAVERDGRKILLPDWKRNLSGIVIAASSGCSEDVVISSRVIFGAAAGMDAACGGEDVRILKESDLDGVYEQA